ncbi:hypothetical protein EK904_011237 [Melospiza melodia maxima]|nr:hypothetical protein EK904_011237 [Melospiza melodia maxima]
MKKDDAVFNTMPLFYCRDNTDVIYFSQDDICQFDISQKTFSNAAMYGNDIARKLSISHCSMEEPQSVSLKFTCEHLWSLEPVHPFLWHGNLQQEVFVTCKRLYCFLSKMRLKLPNNCLYCAPSSLNMVQNQVFVAVCILALQMETPIWTLIQMSHSCCTDGKIMLQGDNLFKSIEQVALNAITSPVCVIHIELDRPGEAKIPEKSNAFFIGNCIAEGLQQVEFNLQQSLLSSLPLPYVVTTSVKAPASVPFHLGFTALFFSEFFYKKSDSFENLDKSFAAYLNQPPAFPKLPGKYNETPEALKPSV